LVVLVLARVALSIVRIPKVLAPKQTLAFFLMVHISERFSLIPKLHKGLTFSTKISNFTIETFKNHEFSFF